MSAVVPETGIAYPALIGGLALEGGQLRIGERLASDREQPKARARQLEPGKAPARIEAGGQEGRREHGDRGGLQLEKARHLCGEAGAAQSARSRWYRPSSAG